MSQLVLVGVFDAEEYWGRFEFKKWVVELTRTFKRGGIQQQERDVKYVRAKYRDGAILTARDNSRLRGSIKAQCRLAHPEDLGCVEASPELARKMMISRGARNMTDDYKREYMAAKDSA
jgi:hypothetical protein